MKANFNGKNDYDGRSYFCVSLHPVPNLHLGNLWAADSVIILIQWPVMTWVFIDNKFTLVLLKRNYKRYRPQFQNSQFKWVSFQGLYYCILSNKFYLYLLNLKGVFCLVVYSQSALCVCCCFCRSWPISHPSHPPLPAWRHPWENSPFWPASKISSSRYFCGKNIIVFTIAYNTIGAFKAGLAWFTCSVKPCGSIPGTHYGNQLLW